MPTFGQQHRVVVGFDGSTPSIRAIDWAVAESRLRGWPLLVAHGWHWPQENLPSDAASMELTRRAARRLLDQGVSHAEHVDSTVAVSAHLMCGSGVGVLVAVAGDDDILIIGAHGSGGPARVGPGSTALRVTSHVRCPAVVVTGGGHEPVHPPVIVAGFDGSPASEHALGFAFEEAFLRHGRIHAVSSSWQAPSESARRPVAARLERATSLWREKYPQVQATTSLAGTPPAAALVEAAQGATLLVVGGRGTETPADVPLGTVREAVLTEAPCPVAVVHAAAPLTDGAPVL